MLPHPVRHFPTIPVLLAIFAPARWSSVIRSSVIGVFLGLLALGNSCATANSARPVAGRPWNAPLAGLTDLTMVWIAPGSFLMGSPAAEPGRKASEGPQTQVALTQGYWLGQDVVTIGQWKALMGAGVRDQLIQMLHDDTLYDFPTGPKRTVRAYMNFSATDPDRPLANQDDNLPMYYIS